MSWWVWIVAGLALAALEVLAPAWVFLGFAIGAAGVGLTLLAGGPLAGWVAGSWGLALLYFAVLSLAAWAGLRLALGVRRGQVRIVERDVNEN